MFIQHVRHNENSVSLKVLRWHWSWNFKTRNSTFPKILISGEMTHKTAPTISPSSKKYLEIDDQTSGYRLLNHLHCIYVPMWSIHLKRFMFKIDNKIK